MSALEQALGGPPIEVVAKATRRRFTVEYKRKIVREADACKTMAGARRGDANRIGIPEAALEPGKGSPAAHSSSWAAQTTSDTESLYPALEKTKLARRDFYAARHTFAHGIRPVRCGVATIDRIEAAFAAMSSQRVGGVLVLRDGLLFLPQRIQIAALAAKNRLPAVYGFREMVEIGGLMSYGPHVPDLYRRAATVIGIVGALIGGWLLPRVGIYLGTGLVAAIVSATVGAVVLLFILGLFRRRRRWW